MPLDACVVHMGIVEVIIVTRAKVLVNCIK